MLFIGTGSIGFGIIVTGILCYVFFSIFGGKRDYSRYNNTPRGSSAQRRVPTLTVAAVVSAKNYSSERGAVGAGIVSFEVESGDILKYAVPRAQFDALNIDDVGKLTFKGEMFVRFEVNERVVGN